MDFSSKKVCWLLFLRHEPRSENPCYPGTPSQKLRTSEREREREREKERLTELFEFLEQFMIGNFRITLAQLEKTISIKTVFIQLKILKLNSTFETRNRSRFFYPFPCSHLESANYVTFSWWISIELKMFMYT